MTDPIQPALVELVKLLAHAVAQEVQVLQRQEQEVLASIKPEPVMATVVAAPTVVARTSGRKWLTIKDVSARLGFSKQTIFRWVHEGFFLPPTKFGHSSRYWLPDIEKWEGERVKKIRKTVPGKAAVQRQSEIGPPSTQHHNTQDKSTTGRLLHAGRSPETHRVLAVRGMGRVQERRFT